MFNTFKFVFLPAFALFLTMQIYYKWVKPRVSPEVPKTTRESKGEVLIGGPFSLTNQDGKTVTDKDFIGKYMLVYFGFANCPMICPTDMADISQALNLLDEEMAEKVQPIFVTVDPERDTVENLKPFLSNFHPKFQGLTGTNQQIADAINAYRVYSKKAESEDLQGYLMDHTAYTYLMGTDGKYIAHFRHDEGAEKIAEGLKRFIK